MKGGFMNKTNKILYGLLALVVYVGFMIGIGFILNLFWKVDSGNLTMYWVVTGLVCFCVAFYTLIMLFGKKDRGVGALQLVLSLGLSFLPIVVRLINMIPYAGVYLSTVLVFLLTIAYLITMLAMGYYATDVNKNSDNRPGGTEI